MERLKLIHEVWDDFDDEGESLPDVNYDAAKAGVYISIGPADRDLPLPDLSQWPEPETTSTARRPSPSGRHPGGPGRQTKRWP